VRERNAPPAHAARPLVWAYAAVGVLFVPVAALAMRSGGFSAAGIALACGAASLAIAQSLHVRIPAVQLVNTAAQHLTRGNIPESEALLASIDRAGARDGIVSRAVATLRALIALYEGRIEESEAFATRAIERRLGILTRSFERQQITAAHAVRALARAARGDADGAKADADVAESSVDATPEVIARARLVRAILASRAAYHEEAFRVYLAANARLVLEHAMPRERALFRALRRMSLNPARSVYREPARVKDDRAPSKLASWIASVAPEAAAYVEGDRLLVESVDEIPIEPGPPSDVRALRSARASKSSGRPGRSRGAQLVLCVILGGASLALWQFLTPTGTEPPTSIATAPPSFLAGFIVDILPVIVIGMLLLIVVSIGRQKQRALSLARRLVALGEKERARPALARLVTGRNGMIAATAGLELARLAAQEAKFAEAISRCDAAIARVQRQPLRAAASDILLPTLMTESAVAMAARGGLDEAAAELEILGRDFPTYSQLATAQLRVRFLSAVHEADRSAACALAKTRTAEMPLPYREDVLADLVLAARGDLAEEDLARLDGELHDDAELRVWLDLVAPGLRKDGPLAKRP
jgi:hypothetical protein